MRNLARQYLDSFSKLRLVEGIQIFGQQPSQIDWLQCILDFLQFASNRNYLGMIVIQPAAKVFQLGLKLFGVSK
jgi:hypothetical protein